MAVHHGQEGQETALDIRSAHENAVVFACDESHLPFAFFAARRIMHVEPQRDFDIVICMPDTTNVGEHLRNQGVIFSEIDTRTLPQVDMPKKWISSAAYYRYLVPRHLRNTYSCLMYLDTDTYLYRSGLSKLFQSIVGSVPLSAVVDTHVYHNFDRAGAERFAQKVRDLGGGTGLYFNSGVWVAQPEQFEAIGGWARFCEAAIVCQRDFQHHRDTDQDAMNLAFAKEILPLNPLFNWLSMAWRHEREVLRYNPFILHFAGPRKPWRLNDDPFTSRFFDEYIAQIRRDFPNFVVTAVEGSLAWRRQHPKHRLPVVENIRNRFYIDRTRKRFRRHQDAHLATKFDRMDEMIAGSIVGANLT